jgi:hypothetical protein
LGEHESAVADAQRSSPRRIRRAIVAWLALCVLLGVMLELLFLLHTGFAFSSRMDVFRQIRLTTPREKAIAILNAGRVQCEKPPVQSVDLCSFSDSWRTYTIYFDSRSGEVVRKAFAYAQPTSSFRKFLLLF